MPDIQRPWLAHYDPEVPHSCAPVPRPMEEPPPHATFLQLLGVAIFLFLGPFFILLSFGLLLLSIYYQASWATVLLLL